MLKLVCHKEPQEIDAISIELAQGDTQATPDGQVSSAEMGAHYQAAIQNGLAINREFADRLSVIAEAVLVSATEQSRRGAGEAFS